MSRASAERVGERPVDLDLLLDGRRFAPVEVEELGADQAGQVGAVVRPPPGRPRPSRGWRRPATSTPSAVTAGRPGGVERPGRAGAGLARRSRAQPARGSRRRGRRTPGRSCRRGRWSCRRVRRAPPARRRRPPGSPRDRARIALCPVGLPGGEHHAADPVRVQLGDLGRREVVGDQHALALDAAVPGAPTRTRATCWPTSRTSAARARRYVVRDAGELGLDRRHRVEPGAGRGRCRAGSARARRRAGRRRRSASGGRRRSGRPPRRPARAAADPDPLDLAADLRDRRADPAPLGVARRRSARRGRRRRRRGWTAPVRSRCRATPAAACRVPAPAAGAAGSSTWSGSSKRRSARATTWSTASRAWLPVAVTSTRWPHSAPSVATRDRLVAGTRARLRCRGCAARCGRRTAGPPGPAARPVGRAGRAGW